MTHDEHGHFPWEKVRDFKDVLSIETRCNVIPSMTMQLNDRSRFGDRVFKEFASITNNRLSSALGKNKNVVQCIRISER